MRHRIAIAQLNGSRRGQTVFHTHFHIMPRFEGLEFKLHAREVEDAAVLGTPCPADSPACRNPCLSLAPPVTRLARLAIPPRRSRPHKSWLTAGTGHSALFNGQHNAPQPITMELRVETTMKMTRATDRLPGLGPAGAGAPPSPAAAAIRRRLPRNRFRRW